MTTSSLDLATWQSLQLQATWPEPHATPCAPAYEEFPGSMALLYWEKLRAGCLTGAAEPPLILCLGCGAGNHLKMMHALTPAVRFIAVDSWWGFNGGVRVPQGFARFACVCSTFKDAVLPWQEKQPHTAVKKLYDLEIAPDVICTRPGFLGLAALDVLRWAAAHFPRAAVLGEAGDETYMRSLPSALTRRPFTQIGHAWFSTGVK